jgi:hypothetical protein
MAINFLNTIDLNKNSLDNARIQNLASDPNAGDSSVGQIYYNTTAQALKIYKEILPATNPKTYEWVEVGSDSVEAGVGIGVTFTGGNVIVRNTGLVTVLDGTYINLTKQGGGDDTELTADLNAVDGTAVLTTRFLSKDNTWDVPVFDDYSSWSLEGDSGTAETVSSGETVDIAGGLKITTDIAANRTLNIVHDLQTQTDTTSTSAPSAGGTFTVIDSVSVDTTGHVGGVNVKTITLPRDDYSIVSKANATAGADVDLVDSLGNIDSTVTFIGTSGEIDVAQSATAGTIVISQPEDVTIGNNLQVDNDAAVDGSLTVAGTGNFTGEVTVPTATAGTSAPNLAQVELLVAGVGVFQGGYNATTDPGVPIISGSANIKLDQGDYFVVSHDGDITFSGTTTTGVNSGALANSTALVLAAANADVAVGMDVTGTGVPPGITILTVTNSTNFVLSSAITIADTTTLTFSDKVVSVEVGDFIFANANIAAASDPAASEYTIVQSDANIAGAGATDGATEKGVAGFDSASFDVSAAGWVQLKPQSNPYGAKQDLNNTAPCTRAEAGGLTTFTIDLTDTSLFGTSALAANVKAEVTQIAAPYETVYADVARSGTGTISFAFTGSVASDVYAALLVYV